LFKRRIGASPHEYITQRRMQRAAEDLLSTDKPVSDIASASGYEHQGHFAAAFKRAYGDNPISFRRSRRSLGAR
jgi:AraC family transcriptional regulator